MFKIDIRSCIPQIPNIKKFQKDFKNHSLTGHFLPKPVVPKTIKEKAS